MSCLTEISLTRYTYVVRMHVCWFRGKLLLPYRNGNIDVTMWREGKNFRGEVLRTMILAFIYRMMNTSVIWNQTLFTLISTRTRRVCKDKWERSLQKWSLGSGNWLEWAFPKLPCLVFHFQDACTELSRDSPTRSLQVVLSQNIRIIVLGDLG